MVSFSLKTKMSLAVSILLVSLISLLSLAVFSFFEAEIKKTITEQQFTLISGLADQIDEKIEVAQKTIITLAGSITPEIINDPDLTQRFLDDNKGARLIFDNGIFLFSSSGKMIAETPFIPGRRGKDYSFREYFKKTMEKSAPYSSLPYFSSQQHHHPSVNFTAPVFAADGKIIAVLAGSVDLMRDNFLGSLSRTSIAKHGYLYLYATDRTMIMHPDKKRILQKDVPVGANKLFDKAIEGFEGTGETVNSRGLHVLGTFKRLKTTNWILASNYPVDEAFASTAKAKRYWLPLTVAIAAVSVLTIWFLMGYLTIPIYLLSNHMKEISNSDGCRKSIRIDSNDEIAELAESFNLMMASLTDKEAALRKLSRAVEQSPGIVLITDVNGSIEYVNPKFSEVTGYTSAEVIGQNPGILKSNETPPDEYDKLWEYVATGEEWRGELLNKKKDGSCYWASTAISAIRNENGAITHFLAEQEDITARKEFEARLLSMALHDNLTGLANRNLLQDRLDCALTGADRHTRRLGILFIDLDHFKQVNDTFGHALGDQLLKEFAKILLRCVRQSDTVARLGGDEFIIMLTEISAPENAGMVAGKIVSSLATPCRLDGHEVLVSASIGIAIYPSDGEDGDTLIRNADSAMYQAKQQGGNRFEFHAGG